MSGRVGRVHPADEIGDEEERVGDGERHQVVPGGGATQAVRDRADGDAERVAEQSGRDDHAHAVEIAVTHRRLDPRHAPVDHRRRRRRVGGVVDRRRRHLGGRIHRDTTALSIIGSANVVPVRKV